MPCHLLALLLGTFLGVIAQTIHQWPATRVQLVGSALSLECTVKGVSSPNLYWYRQATGGGDLQLLFHSIGVDQKDPEKLQNFNASRPQDGLFILSSTKLLLSNSGFYLCAWSLTLHPVGQTSVQKPCPLPSSHHPLQEPSLKDWLEDVFVIEFLTGSQCEGN
uniref:Ig-like domain-containing protein n=2 Tax=Sus scrofa TaxID=9823 RepID=A0A8D0YXX1_PIG